MEERAVCVSFQDLFFLSDCYSPLKLTSFYSKSDISITGSGDFCMYLPSIFISDLSGVNKRLAKYLVGKALWKKACRPFYYSFVLLQIE